MRPIGLTVAAVAVAGTGVAAESSTAQPYPVSDWLPDLLVGMALAGGGLLLCARRRGNLTGLMLVLASLAWFLPNFAGAWPGWPGAISAGSVFLHRGFLLHGVVAAPSGRTHSRRALAVIALVYAASVSPAAWNNDAVAIALVIAVLTNVWLDYLSMTGYRRAVRIPAVVAATVFAVLIASEILVRRTVARPPDALLLTVYQVAVVTVSGILVGGLLVSRTRLDEVTDLVVELAGARSATLRDRLASVLGDPSLLVGYWIAEEQRYVDADGRPVDLPDGSTRAITPVDRGEAPVAVLVHDPALLADGALIDAVGAAARLNAANVRLRAELRARVAEAQESRRRMVDAAVEERRRLELRLRDGVLGRLDKVADLLGVAHRSAAEVDTAVVDAATEHLAETREDLLRLARGIHPGRLSQQGLTAALQTLATGVAVKVSVDAEAGALPDAVSACIWFICAEALANALKHAAASQVEVSVQRVLDLVVVRVADDGVGGADASLGSGLRGLGDRVAALGGTLHLESPGGAGTVILAMLPTSRDA